MNIMIFVVRVGHLRQIRTSKLALRVVVLHKLSCIIVNDENNAKCHLLEVRWANCAMSSEGKILFDLASQKVL